MGGGSYDINKSLSRGASYASMDRREVFTQKNINNAMSPYGITFRESLDTEQHPNTVPIIIALDVTGSMGTIPHKLISKGLPTMIAQLLQVGIADPQILFLGIGDHECDRSPLQVGQFESSDELIEKWLKDTYLEGGGGGNGGESYLLAWYFAARHTKIDAFDKRGKKGFLFTIGDEPTLPVVPVDVIKSIMGGQGSEIVASNILDEARKKYNVYHLHISETSSGSRESVKDGWKQLMGDSCIVVENSYDIARTIAELVVKEEAKINPKVKTTPKTKENEMML